MRTHWFILLCAACSNSLPPPGTCEVPTSGEAATAEQIALGGPGSYDDLAFSKPLRKIVAAPQGTGRVHLIEVDTKNFTTIAVPGGTGSADASATTLYVADRGNSQIVSFDVTSGAKLASHTLTAEPDYVRVAPTTGEVWVTLPGRNRLDILDPVNLAVVGSVTTPTPPEGLTFDEAGRAFVNNDGTVVAIDVARRVVVGEWDVGCGYSHGFPQVDTEYNLAIGGCRPNGGAGITTMTGEQRAGFEAGGGAAVLAYDSVRHHLYLRGDPSPTLSILAVCSTGELGVLASVPIPDRGHASAADDRGNVWLGDSTTGGVVLVTDPFPGTN
jgi:DNA-binding beta-propeller fold protein YncE